MDRNQQIQEAFLNIPKNREINIISIWKVKIKIKIQIKINQNQLGIL